MPEENEKTSIELLPKKTFEELSFSKKLTTWVINVGRVIIIVTELIAFSVFIGRIKLDRELTDLTDALEDQLVIIKNAEAFASDFKDLQNRVAIIKKLRQQQVPVSKHVSLFTSLLPKDAELVGLTVSEEEGSYLIIKANSALAFARTVQNLKNSRKIEEIALTSGRFSTKDGAYRFSLMIRFRKDIGS